jgi:hypothetical protein
MFSSIHHEINRLQITGMSYKCDYDNYNPDACVRVGRVEGSAQHRAHSGAGMMQGQAPVQRVPYNDRVAGRPGRGGPPGSQMWFLPPCLSRKTKRLPDGCLV